MGVFGHLCHAVMTVLFFPWVFVWIICALCMGSSRKREDREIRQEELELLRKIANRGDNK